MTVYSITFKKPTKTSKCKKFWTSCCQMLQTTKGIFSTGCSRFISGSGVVLSTGWKYTKAITLSLLALLPIICIVILSLYCITWGVFEVCHLFGNDLIKELPTWIPKSFVFTGKYMLGTSLTYILSLITLYITAKDYIYMTRLFNKNVRSLLDFWKNYWFQFILICVIGLILTCGPIFMFVSLVLQFLFWFYIIVRILMFIKPNTKPIEYEIIGYIIAPKR